jgi:hypothetical protein
VIGMRAPAQRGQQPAQDAHHDREAIADEHDPGVMRKLKAISLKLWVWPVPVEKPFIGNASRQPIAPR